MTTTSALSAAAVLILAHQYDRAWLACACGYPAINRPTWAHHVAQLAGGGAA